MVRRRKKNDSRWKEAVSAMRVRWVLAFAVAVIGALALNANQAAAAEAEHLDCGTVMERKCSLNEELAFCIINSFQDYDECKEHGGFWNDVGCYFEYVGEFYWCYLGMGETIFLN